MLNWSAFEYLIWMLGLEGVFIRVLNWSAFEYLIWMLGMERVLSRVLMKGYLLAVSHHHPKINDSKGECFWVFNLGAEDGRSVYQGEGVNEGMRFDSYDCYGECFQVLNLYVWGLMEGIVIG